MFHSILAQRAAENNPIRVGIIGTGKFGGGLVAQLSQMRGMEAVAIADINLEHARNAYTASGVPEDAIKVVRNRQEMNAAIRSGARAITEDGLVVAHSDLIDVVTEATGIPEEPIWARGAAKPGPRAPPVAACSRPGPAHEPPARHTPNGPVVPSRAESGGRRS